MRKLVFALWIAAIGMIWLGAAVAPTPIQAQDRTETLVEIRAQLAQLAGEISALRAEMLASGEAGLQVAGGSALDRMNAIEAELVRLTGRTEALGNRIDKVVADGTNRVKNLEFRLCEMEEGCDISNLPISRELGGPAKDPAPVGSAEPAEVPKLASSEQADFDRARAALDGGDYHGAAEMFATFVAAYTGGPLTGEAHFLRGEALRELGQPAEAAREYLETFSAAPDGPLAANSLLRLGQSLGELGQTQEACLTLEQVAVRFPGVAAEPEAAESMQSLGCQ